MSMKFKELVLYGGLAAASSGAVLAHPYAKYRCADAAYVAQVGESAPIEPYLARTLADLEATAEADPSLRREVSLRQEQVTLEGSAYIDMRNEKARLAESEACRMQSGSLTERVRGTIQVLTGRY